MAKKRKDTGYRVAVSGARRLVSLLLFALVLLIIFFLGRTAYHFGYSVFHQVPMSDPPGENITVSIPEDADMKEIGTILKNAGLVSDVTLFRVQERLSEYHTQLKKDGVQGGTFRLNTSLTTDEILAVLAGETTDVQTVPEPQTESDVRDPNAEEKLINDVTNDSSEEVPDPNAEQDRIDEVTPEDISPEETGSDAESAADEESSTEE